MTAGTLPLRPLPGSARAPLVVVAVAALTILAAALPGWSGVVLVGFLAAVALFAAFRVAGVVIVTTLLPFVRLLEVETAVGTLSMSYLAVLALVTAVGPGLIRRRAVRFDRLSGLWLMMIVALVASVGSSVGSSVSTGAAWIAEVAGWVLPAGIYLMVSSMGLPRRAILPVLDGIAVSVVVMTAMAAWQVVTGTRPAAFITGGLMRAYGPFGHPNPLAAWLALTVPILWALALMVDGRWISGRARLGLIVAASAGSVGLLLTQSRTGLMAFGVAMLVVIAYSPRMTRCIATGMAGTSLLVLVATGTLASVPGLDRFAAITVSPGERVQVTPGTWGQQERLAHWGAGSAMLREYPWSGVGAGNFTAMYREYTPEWRFRIPRDHAHNGWLHIGAEAGVPGLLAFTAWVSGSLALLATALVRSNQRQRPAATVGALAAMAAFAVASLFEYVRFDAVLVLMAIIQASGMAAVAPARQGSAA